ncbi:MAG: hypothetical protein AB7S26_39395 [Sandaracinaceae bacterium]
MDAPAKPPRRFRRRGIAPRRLYEQVQGTAAWALEEGASAESWRAILNDAETVEPYWRESAARVDYLRVMLAAHFTTVATLVPTDVDTHIRHHLWQEIETRHDLEEALLAVDEAATWNPRAVSARVVHVEGVGDVSGHAGEWFSVRAGALGRALLLEADDAVERLIAAIDAELDREARAFAIARASGDLVLALSVATISAHNCGDLSRVVEAWHRNTPHKGELVRRFAKLGHEDASRYGGEHHLAGHVNKEVMASENHRNLPLRDARCLRKDRSLIVPIGPFFDAWGEMLGATPLLDERDRGEALAALLHGVFRSVDRWGYHRAIAGLHRTSPGGLERLVPHLPARFRSLARKGTVRDALRVSEPHFLARMDKVWRDALATYPGRSDA